jgi:tetratricopeptide (TPR) repeat protein
MSVLGKKSRLSLLFVGDIALVSLVALWWYAQHSPTNNFLASGAPGDWILYPTPVDSAAQIGVDYQAVFERTFKLKAVPNAAVIEIRAFERYTISLNDQPIGESLDPTHSWKETARHDVVQHLRTGENRLKINVINNVGPPALSCRLACDDVVIASDGNWNVSLSGAVTRPARLASAPLAPGPGNKASGGEKTLVSVRIRWPILFVFAAISTGLIFAADFAVRRLGARKEEGPRNSATRVPEGTRRSGKTTTAPLWRGRLASAIWIVPVLLWLILFINNDRSLPFALGFDAKGHSDYIRYVQEHKALPLADEGWEMHHPPLYYVISASLLGTFGAHIDDTSAVTVLRGLSVALGIAQTLLLFACVRLIFAGEPGKQLVGLLLAVFLPAQLYLFQYVSNETLATALGTASIYLGLTILRNEHSSSLRFALLGLCLGAAMLTKVTAILVAAVVLGTLAGRLIVLRQRDPLVWLRTLGLATAVCLATSGWHYARVWWHFGSPFVGNYDAASTYSWWQDPGYCAPSYFLRFGRSLIDPYFSGFSGYVDGFYSTLWGDGMWGGEQAKIYRPPWNYDLMSAGYLLALAPAALMLIGGIAAVVELVRRPRAELFLLIGLPVAFALAALYQYLRFPYYAHAKAIYALTVAVSLCAFGVWGFELLTRRWKAAGLVAGIALGTWALTAFASYCVQGSRALAWQGERYYLSDRSDRVEQALKCWKGAVRADPDNLMAHTGLAKLYLEASHDGSASRQDKVKVMEAARRELQQVLHADPDDPEALTLLAVIAAETGPGQEGLQKGAALLRHAIETRPEYLQAPYTLGKFLEDQGLNAEAIDAYRRGIGIAPGNTQIRLALGALLVEIGNLPAGIEQYRVAVDAQTKRDPPPDAFHAMSGLAWIRATTADSRFRDGAEAVNLAETACKLTDYKDAGCLSVLGAAYAEAGRYVDAERLLQQSLPIAKSRDDQSLIALVEKQLALCMAMKPYRQDPQRIPQAIK